MLCCAKKRVFFPTHRAVDKQDGKEPLDVSYAESDPIEEKLRCGVPRRRFEPPHAERLACRGGLVDFQQREKRMCFSPVNAVCGLPLGCGCGCVVGAHEMAG
jgi:hypothetical protein